MHDTLDREDVLIDPSLTVFERAPELPPTIVAPDDGAPWWTKFYDPDHDKYDWEDPEWKGGFRRIDLTQGYFMIVSHSDYKRMTTFPDGTPKVWQVKIDRDEFGDICGVYGRRRGRGEEPATVYAHREARRCLFMSADVDHVNGYGLDNRRRNLIPTSTRRNSFNIRRNRRVNTELLPGVEKRGVNLEGKQRYGGIRARRLKKSGKGSVKTFRSKRTWLSQEPANRWYLNQLKMLSGGRVTWAHSPKSVNFPAFPPLMEREPSARSTKLRQRQQSQLEAIPF